MPLEAGAPPASTDTSTPNSGGDARDAIESELDSLMKASSQREDEAKQEAPTADDEQKPDDEDKAKQEGEPAPEKKEDPRTARSLAAIAREKQKLMQDKAQIEARLSQEVAKHEATVKEHAALVQQAQRWQASLRGDAFSAVMDAMPDMTPEQADLLARQFYQHAKSPTNPELRAQAAQRKAQSEAAAQVEATRREMAEMKAQIEAERKAVKNERDLNEYLGQVEAVVGDDTPLLAKAMKKNVKVTRGELAEVARHIAQRTGLIPDPSEVAKGWETIRSSELRDRYDLDADALLKPAVTQKPNPVADEKQRPKTTINSELGSTTRPRSTSLSQDELDAEIERELAARMRGGG